MTGPSTRRIRPGSVFFALWLVVLWNFLWGGPTLANVLSGCAIAATVLVLVPRRPATGDDPIVRPIALISYLLWFSWKLIEANVTVAIEVLRPLSRSRIRTGIVAVPMAAESHAILTAVANSVTLTPGTLTLEVDQDTNTLFIHVLQLDDPDEVRREVYEIERRIVAAAGSASSRAAVAERIAAS